MSPMGDLTVEESSSGIIKVTLDPKIESGEFYQVCVSYFNSYLIVLVGWQQTSLVKF